MRQLAYRDWFLWHQCRDRFETCLYGWRRGTSQGQPIWLGNRVPRNHEKRRVWCSDWESVVRCRTSRICRRLSKKQLPDFCLARRKLSGICWTSSSAHQAEWIIWVYYTRYILKSGLYPIVTHISASKFKTAWNCKFTIKCFYRNNRRHNTFVCRKNG